jgi:hypothetical protein
MKFVTLGSQTTHGLFVFEFAEIPQNSAHTRSRTKRRRADLGAPAHSVELKPIANTGTIKTHNAITIIARA